MLARGIKLLVEADGVVGLLVSALPWVVVTRWVWYGWSVEGRGEWMPPDRGQVLILQHRLLCMVTAYGDMAYMTEWRRCCSGVPSSPYQ